MGRHRSYVCFAETSHSPQRLFSGQASNRLDSSGARFTPEGGHYAERLIGSIRRECVDHIIVVGERHLRHVLLLYKDYYNPVS